MLEELTPQLLSFSMLLIVVLAPPLALLLSALLLWRYKRAVLRAMASSAAATQGVSEATLPPVPSSASGLGRQPGTGLLAHLLTAPRLASGRVVLGGLAYALTMAAAVLVVHEPMRTLPRFALAVWVALWPVIPALALTAAAPLRTSVIALAVYAAPMVIVLSAVLLWPVAPLPTFGDEYAAIRAGLSPPEVLQSWLVGNAAPTVLLLLFLNRWTRAVGPLVVAFVTLVLIACLVSILAFATPRGTAVLDAVAQATTMSAFSVVAGLLLLAAALGAAVGAALLHRVRIGYLKKTLNDRSLTLDAVWLIFAGFHSVLFVLVGLSWFAVSVLGWFAYRWVSRLPVLRAQRRHAPHGLVFLRVFSLGRRSEKLFDALARHWRHAGSIQLITGPDLAHSTVQPHQFLDFVSRRLAGHFIGDERSLVQRIALCDRAPDADGLYRVNSLFCHADTWEAALVHLIGQGDVVLMDLRSFGKHNSGCIAELRHLVHRVPLARCTFVVDDTTDREFLQHTLHKVWEEMPPQSPNWASVESAAPLQRLDAGHRGLVSLLGRLAVPT